jgi:hypothetical protein
MDWAAKALLASIKYISLMVSPAFFSALLEAGANRIRDGLDPSYRVASLEISSTIRLPIVRLISSNFVRTRTGSFK